MKLDETETTETSDTTETIAIEQDGRPPTSRALHLFGSGVLGGVLTILGLGVLAEPLSHTHCHGASASQREQDRETRRRCMELGVTPDELAALDAAATRIGGE